MSTCEDPEGRLKVGQRIRWSHSDAGSGDMEIIELCEPCGLYWRALRADDDEHTIKMAAKYCPGQTPCEKDDPDAVYHPENLMVVFKYIGTGNITNGHAIHMTVVK